MTEGDSKKRKLSSSSDDESFTLMELDQCIRFKPASIDIIPTNNK